jgi:hypothetical protein
VDRRTRNLFVLVLVLVLGITGGAALVLNETSIRDPNPSGSGSFMVGVVVGVDARGLGDVRSFQLRRLDGAVVVFQLGELENGDQFPPGHLGEHQATAQPVRVWYVMEGEQRFAVRLEDAGG